MSDTPSPPNLLNLYNLGCHHMDSCDYSKALAHFTTAASYNHPLSCHNLAVMKERGLGCRADYEDAIKYYGIAAERRFPEVRVAREAREGNCCDERSEVPVTNPPLPPFFRVCTVPVLSRSPPQEPPP